MNQKTKRWLVALFYVGFIYATLGVVRAPVGYLRSLGLLRISLGILYGITVVTLLWILYRNGRLTRLRFSCLTLVALSYWYICKWVKTPEEQIHFFQYGLVGVLFARAIQLQTNSRLKIFFGALFLASIAGWLDEILQGHMPTRHYDVRDIYLNIVSAFLGLVLLQLFSERSDLQKV
jgi:glycopeptide antibiotics resistance protein